MRQAKEESLCFSSIQCLSLSINANNIRHGIQIFSFSRLYFWVTPFQNLTIFDLQIMSPQANFFQYSFQDFQEPLRSLLGVSSSLVMSLCETIKTIQGFCVNCIGTMLLSRPSVLMASRDDGSFSSQDCWSNLRAFSLSLSLPSEAFLLLQTVLLLVLPFGIYGSLK